VKTDDFTFHVELRGQPCAAELGFANERELLGYHRSLRRWGRKASTPVREAIEFTHLAAKRWRYYSRAGEAVENLAELRRALHQDAICEVAFVLLARLRSPHRESSIGLAYCRRTWCHHLALDFLALHPRALGSDPRIIGTGSGIVYGLVQLASVLEIPRIWGEATVHSAGFYEELLGVQLIRDLFVIEAPEMSAIRR